MGLSHDVCILIQRVHPVRRHVHSRAHNSYDNGTDGLTEFGKVRCCDVVYFLFICNCLAECCAGDEPAGDDGGYISCK